MPLSNDLISQFVKLTKSDKKQNKETIAYGTVAKIDHKDPNDAASEITAVWVRLDGADENNLTPLSRTTDVSLNDRVIVMIKNHSAVITGNITSPSARTEYVKIVETKTVITDNKVTELDYLKVDKVTADELYAEKVKFNELTVEVARIDDVKAEKLTVETLTSDYGEFKRLTSENLVSVNATIEALDSNYANINFSNIGKAAMEYFYAQSGLIKDVEVGDMTITGELVGVTLSGDRIKGNTIIADKLVLKGSDGLYYKLNTDGTTTELEQTDENSLNGSIIQAKSITATKIDVNDLVAFGATIGGFKIDEDSISSIIKDSAGNLIRGVYLDSFGQVNFGDNENYVKYYKDTDGTYKLDISAGKINLNAVDLTVRLDSASKTASNYINATVDGLVVGDMTLDALGENIIIGTSSIKIRNGSIVNSVFGADVIELSKDNESATISMLNGAFKIYYDSDLSDGGFGVYGKDLDGNDRLAFQPVNENGNTTLGWGNYEAGDGNTNIYGNDVHIGVSYNGTIKETFRPYYREGDSFTTRFRGAGYVTTGGKSIRFCIPLAKPVIGNPTVSITSNGFILRQNGKYTHGSSDSSTTQPDSIAAVVDADGNFIRIGADFSNVTDVTNNDAIGIDWEGIITFG